MDAARPGFLYVASWEVCNRLGGVHTVLATSAPHIDATYGEDLLYIGPDLWADRAAQADFVEDAVQPEQGAIYRLSGDPNPIHIDPDFARMAGFEAPFLHGLCTYGIVGRAILNTVCGNDPKRFVSFSARFADQVFYGDDVITKIWETGSGEGIVRAESQKGNTVLSQARVSWKA